MDALGVVGYKGEESMVSQNVLFWFVHQAWCLMPSPKNTELDSSVNCILSQMCIVVDSLLKLIKFDFLFLFWYWNIINETLDVFNKVAPFENTYIGTQQLDFLGNFQCRLNFLDNMHKEARAQIAIPILFNTTQMGYLSIVGTVLYSTWTLIR